MKCEEMIFKQGITGKQWIYKKTPSLFSDGEEMSLVKTERFEELDVSLKRICSLYLKNEMSLDEFCRNVDEARSLKDN